MRAIVVDSQEGPGVLAVREVPRPRASKGEVVLDIASAGVNRADLLQRRGRYPSPAGWPDWPGLECAGVVTEIGAGVSGIHEGDTMCALVGGGAYADAIVVPADLTLPVPAGLDLVAAGGLMEAACTVWSNFDAATAATGETLVVHGGAGGVGSLAIEIGKAMGLRVVATAGGPERARWAEQLGADVGVDYRAEDFVEVVRSLGGADVILDVVGAGYLERNLEALAVGGRLVVIGLQQGSVGRIDLGSLMAKRLRVIGTTLRSRPHRERAEIVAAVGRDVWPWIPAQVAPKVHAAVPLEEAERAHEMMLSGEVAGKVVLVP
ncbi:NAD(P)H-quinone oxidoreductase [Demequina sp. TTPB684]|uniref:NAD(P)H-quinone oxidoreductase n=1 Tax=unclassified Demequina TaxID=2620311 RepID=UPI001CF44192|nr:MULTISPECIES: NAD(P)H-quinone oxidoreductase [unclassified Demequina]MCB2413690.1 NAD(P)H-quinone oxidoreductase [Demequina sp. TTPB684]UPU87752.1 NAD(P)H-quinone oxidoreductase [Demequina sp. TMPB413]